MFLDTLIKSNPQLIRTAFEFHREGLINPNTYVLDLDSIVNNAKLLFETANYNSIDLYMMTKQIGRNPDVAKAIAKVGIDKAVVVDPWEAIELGRAGIKIGNVGHLVQIPSNMLEEIIRLSPEVITVFSVEKAKEISNISKRLGITSKLMLKVVGLNDFIYAGQVGGFTEDEIMSSAKIIQELPNVKIEGITAFPCFLYDYENKKVSDTENAHTLIRTVRNLKDKLGLEIKQINAPSITSIETIPLLKELGATHGEPGHAFTGTTPAHGYTVLKEKTAMVYISEISHLYGDNAYVYGGGFYGRSHLTGALVGDTYDNLMNNFLHAEDIQPESIDYYGTLKLENKKAKVGDTAIYCFRTQIFVTRSQVAVIEGITKDKPKLVGIYDSQGRKLKV